ncbi:MAG TPA: SemiSWEET transporter [Flavobacterium sp.]|nr:SemiSWEET transporter [Flavobacterium sp.]
MVDIIGYTAAVLTAFASGPQAIKVIRSGKTKDISSGTYAILVAGLILWIIYGIYKTDWPLILSNSIATLLSGTVLVAKILEKKREA